MSLRAGGLGLNLTAANHVFHFDRWWNPAVEDQASDRAHRIGQTRVVQVHKMVCAGTIEERIDELIAGKRDLAARIVDRGVESALSELGDDELAELVALRDESDPDTLGRMTALELLHRLVELESPTSDSERLSHIGLFIAAELDSLGGRVEFRGRHLLARYGDGGPPLVLAAHMDTVWPTGRSCRCRSGSTAGSRTARARST